MSDLDNFTKAELIATVEELAGKVDRIDRLLDNVSFSGCPPIRLCDWGIGDCRKCWFDWMGGNQ